MISNKRLDKAAKKLLKRICKLSSEQEQIDILKNLLFTATLRHTLFFNKRLTPQEILCLQHIAEGKTALESADLLGIKPSTVETHRKELKRKLSCNSMAQAVFEGMRFGYLASTATAYERNIEYE